MVTSDRSNNKHHRSLFNPGDSHLKLKYSGFMAIASHLNHDNCIVTGDRSRN
ncbi:hypothetical protein [Anabaena sp. CCY 9910]|uniref:hypothetical protein n=1 Tax=Anabaena sp. CCY 9910 TaxID=3103870 RepID=UPI0039E19288